ncbi:nucleotidyltransferase domain-containing protein (plasmid) [Streptomyces sp. NBC_00853]|uniref:nucleotidyltransferase domain-containing protein n=1 Tax=Streptomyces sp. NBC_00853 TaxID=2903681 RepID=UPI003872B3CF|nr:nucleotidyltransferase domain-containing protein [Streptomyces sp. NBC_00853]
MTDHSYDEMCRANVYKDSLGELKSRGFLPEDFSAVFIGGSVARGWNNPLSDIDFYVVVPEPWTSATSDHVTVPLTPNRIVTEAFDVDGRRWEIRYWLSSQLDQVLEKISWEDFDGGVVPAYKLNHVEETLLERISKGLPVAGQGWIEEKRRIIDASALKAITVTRELGASDDLVEDALGQLENNDIPSAILSARAAFGHSVNALLAGAGDYDGTDKWRSRRMRAVNPELLPYDLYWEVETMRRLDSQSPEEWVIGVSRLCKRLARKLSF